MGDQNHTPKRILSGSRARRRVLRAVERFARPVAATLGPLGRNVIIQKPYGTPTITKDGVTVAREIELPDPFMNLAARLIKEAALRCVSEVGDGTTTTTVLAAAIIREGIKLIEAGYDAAGLKRGLDLALPVALAAINRLSVSVDAELLAAVTASAANHDQQIGRLVREAVEAVGEDGVIVVNESQSIDTKIRLVDGIHYDKGWFSPSFATDLDKPECVLENCFVLVVEEGIQQVSELVPIMQQAQAAGHPLLVICEELSEAVLALLVVNHLNGALKCCAVKVPYFGDTGREMLIDIATATGGFALTSDLHADLSKLILDDLGMAARVIVNEQTTTISEGAGNLEALQQRIRDVRQQIACCTSDKGREKLQDRLGKLIGGVCVIEVGARTEPELKEKKMRVDDALHAAFAAIKEGVVAGGGCALLKARQALIDMCLDNLNADQSAGVHLLFRAMEAPLQQIAQNAGLKGDLVVASLENAFFEHNGHPVDFVYDVVRERISDMREAGVIDATSVTRLALTTAVSISGLLLLSEVFITEKPEPKKPKAVLPERLKRTVKGPAYEPKRIYSK